MFNNSYGGYGAYTYQTPTYNPQFTSANMQNMNYGLGNQIPNVNTNTNANANTNMPQYVNGLEGAKAYMVLPNSTAFILDSDGPFFYIKTANAQGQCSLKTFKYEEVNTTAPKVEQIDTSQFVTREEFETLKKKLEAPKQVGGTTK